MPEIGDYRLTENCEICNAPLRECYSIDITKFGHSRKWELETHTLKDCVKKLAERIEALENK